MVLTNIHGHSTIYSSLRRQIEYLHFSSAYYDMWLTRAAKMCWNPAIGAENMKPIKRILGNDGNYVSFYYKI